MILTQYYVTHSLLCLHECFVWISKTETHDWLLDIPQRLESLLSSIVEISKTLPILEIFFRWNSQTVCLNFNLKKWIKNVLLDYKMGVHMPISLWILHSPHNKVVNRENIHSVKKPNYGTYMLLFSFSKKLRLFSCFFILISFHTSL